MQTLRTSLTLARLVLAWFALTLGVATAAPVLQPQTLVKLCSAEGSKIIVVDAHGDIVQPGAHALDCPLCLPVYLPPAASTPRLPVPHLPADLPSRGGRSHVPAAPGAPLPARGPPA